MANGTVYIEEQRKKLKIMNKLGLIFRRLSDHLYKKDEGEKAFIALTLT